MLNKLTIVILIFTIFSCKREDVVFKTDFTHPYFLEFENLDKHNDIEDFVINIPAKSYKNNFKIFSGKYKVTFKNPESGKPKYKQI
tara:strand:- start:1013 stop:1270 length:258 start_codon:yes stop_codon:yes gene_type:complete